MKRKILRLLTVCGVCLALFVSSEMQPMQITMSERASEDAPSVMKERLLAGVNQLEKSRQLYFEDGLTITGLGVNYSGNAAQKTDNFYWPAIKQMTGVDLDIFWTDKESYLSSLSTMLLTGSDQMPDILNAADFGVMDLADDGIVIPLDEYLDLMPDIVAAVGEERMNYWRQSDGHIYTIPSITDVPGAKTMMVRKDWLDKLGLSEPQTWEEWVNLWRAIRDHDLNGNGDPSDEIPFACQYGTDGERCLIPLMNAFGIKVSGDAQFCQLEDGTYTMVYEHPKYPEFLQAVRELYEEGLIADDFDRLTLDALDTAMDENRVGTAFNWAERCRTSAQTLRKSGVGDALWEAVAPIAGPDGTQMTPERLMLSSIWCISSEAEKSGKASDIVRFFNWCYTKEGSYLYSYGLPGISYAVVDGLPVLDSELLKAGFTDYRTVGCNVESFGGLWQEGAFTQCLFEGRSSEEMDELTEEFYKGISVVNQDYFYTMPATYQTPSYTKYRNALITEGVCRLRDQAIKGEMSTDEFFAGYQSLKQRGLQAVIDEVSSVGKHTQPLNLSKKGDRT